MRQYLLFSLIITALNAGAQHYRLSAGFNGGYVIPHRPVMQYLIQGHSASVSLEYERRLVSSDWHINYRYPWWGIRLEGINTGNTRELGHAFGLTPFLNLPLTANPDCPLSFKAGFGAGILTRKYHRQENHKNVAIGSGLNASVLLGLEYRFKLTSSVGGKATFALQHFSNGSYKAPNLGLNIPMLGLAVYAVNTRPIEYLPATGYKKTTQKTSFTLSPKIGVKELIATENTKYFIYNLNASAIKPLSNKVSFAIFADVFHNKALATELALEESAWSGDRSFQAGAGAGIENTFGSLSAYLQMGVYAVTPPQGEGIFYHRLGVKKHFGKIGFCTFGLKSHFAKADYIEAGGGIRL